MTVSYCPLDLYSGNPERVKTAINALWEDWKSTSGTFNNLRIYLDGKLLHPNDVSTIPMFFRVRLTNHVRHPQDLTPLLSRMPEEYSKDGSTTVHDAFAAYIASILLGSGVLPSLSRLQRTLDELNIEGLETLLGRFQSPEKSDDISPTVRDLLRQATVDEWAAFTALYEDRIMDEEPTPADLSALTASDARYWVLSCLLSGTFKDCSLMISSTDHAVRVIDMDPKLTSKLPGWAKLDSQIVETYAALPAEKRKRCVDAQLPQHVYEEERPVRRMMMLKDLGTFPFLMAITAIFIALSVILPALPFRK
jgi:inositol-pentakisphosphate 2-kinase